jgi:UDP-N-acetylmuramate dehydrogenase
MTTDGYRRQWDLPALLCHVSASKRFGASLARYTSFRIGGPADVLVRTENLEVLQHIQALTVRHGIPLFILGGGSNLLIRDGGIRGIVIIMRGDFRLYRVELCEHTATLGQATVHAGVGCTLSRLALRLAQQGWSGLEFAYGIPGTLGGAMVMNAGTYLGELSQVLSAARMLLPDGQVCELPSHALGLRYRGSSYPAGAILLQATLCLQQGERDAIEAAMYASYQRRQQTQPLWLPNAGSIFKNPPGVAAARLIDALGLKGMRIGGAMVSPVHANFLVNVDRATAADVEALMALIQERVQRAYGITLEPEIRIVGEY